MPQVPPSKSPTQFKLCSFDIYGTLIDWESGIEQALLSTAPIAALPANHALKSSRTQLLSGLEREERLVQAAQPGLQYPAVLGESYKRMLAAAHVPARSAAELERAAAEFARSVGAWPAFADTVAAMRRLARRYRLVPLSNVDDESLRRTLDGPLRGVPFAAVYTAEQIGSYKPDPANFEYLIKHVGDEFGIAKDEIWHVAQSLHHDHVPASEMGFEPGVWVDRRGIYGKPGEGLDDKAKYGWKVGSLGELADIADAAFAEAAK